jgi:hypothetical protein
MSLRQYSDNSSTQMYKKSLSKTTHYILLKIRCRNIGQIIRKNICQFRTQIYQSSKNILEYFLSVVSIICTNLPENRAKLNDIFLGNLSFNNRKILLKINFVLDVRMMIFFY